MTASELIQQLQALIAEHGDCRIDIDSAFSTDAAVYVGFSPSDGYGDAIVIKAEG